MKANNEILIIGPPKSGKTTFLAQLYGRLINRMGKLSIIETPDNIEAIKQAYKHLATGREPESTPATDNLEVNISVALDGHEFLLSCKDYGGEQVRDLVGLMEYDKTWIERAKDNDRWILFIRPSEIDYRFDLSMKGYAEKDIRKRNAPNTRTSDQSQFIELLQVLLHARDKGMKEPIDTPRLLIALTCWDELSTDSTPEEVLQQKMPLFFQFVAANWEGGASKIIGVSAQEFPLNSDEACNKYRENMPQNFGYLVLDDNPKEKDLTRLIEESLSL